MASITQKDNGSYLIRVYCGTDDLGKQQFKSKIFRPSRKNLPYPKLNKEINDFIKAFETEAQEEIQHSRYKKTTEPCKMPFSLFCKAYNIRFLYSFIIAFFLEKHKGFKQFYCLRA